MIREGRMRFHSPYVGSSAPCTRALRTLMGSSCVMRITQGNVLGTKTFPPAASSLWCWRDTTTPVRNQTGDHTVCVGFKADVQIWVATLAIHLSSPLFARNASVAENVVPAHFL